MIIIVIDDEDDKMMTTRQNASKPASDVCAEMSLEGCEFSKIKTL